MKAYIAGRVKEANLTFPQIRSLLHELGYEITFDWALEKVIKQPYKENQQEAIKLAESSRQGALDCDVFILIWDESLYGALIELGIALGKSSLEKMKSIYIFGKKDRICVFEILPEFKTVQNLTELKSELEK